MPLTLGDSVSGFESIPAAPVERMALHTVARTFTALIEVTSPGVALWEFPDDSQSNSLNPSIDFGSTGDRIVYLTVTPWTALTVLNLGFSGGDSGLYMPDTPHTLNANVASIDNLDLAKDGLEIISIGTESNAWNTGLDLSGFTALQFVEAYLCRGASFHNIDLTGCTSLIRVCLEGDFLYTVAGLETCTALRDFRNRGNTLISTYDFGDNPLDHLYHFCVGTSDSLTTFGWEGKTLPAMTQMWIWQSGHVVGEFACNAAILPDISAAGCGYTSADLSGCPALTNVNFSHCHFNQTAVDSVLSQLAERTTINGAVTLNGSDMGQPSSAGLASATTLRGRGWTVTHRLTAQLTELREHGVWFGHQSVGMNILTGTQAIITAVSTVSLSITQTSTPASLGVGVLAHDYNGENLDPAGKITAFDTAIRSGIGAALAATNGAAVLKFCWVDFTASTDVAALETQLDSVWTALRTDFPAVEFIMCTVPLMSTEDGANAVREQMSNHIRLTTNIYSRVCDIALAESTHANGTRNLISEVPALCSEYTTDGGHPDTTAGSDAVARVFIAALENALV